MIRRLPMKLAAAAFSFALALQPAAAIADIFPSASVFAAPAPASAAPYAYSRALKNGCRGQDVKGLQTKLKQLGYYKSALDGVFGSGTLSAVKALQRASSLKADGIVGKATYNAICKASASVPKGNSGGTGSSPGTTGTTPVNNNTPYTYSRALKVGCKGQDVKGLQTKLKQLGYYKSVLDGAFGNGTQSAVKAFQRAASLKADGIVGKATYSAICKAGASTPVDGNAGGSGGAGNGNAGGATGDKGQYQYGALNNQITLKMGSKGSDVKDLQTALKQKGFFTGSVTGVFDSKTQTSVKNFQKSVKLDVDGLAGNYTLSALYTMLDPPDLSTITPWRTGLNPGLNIKVEKLTWDAVKDSVFKHGLNAVVVDVRSGYVFQIRRTGGTLHADVETLTPLDTATFYKNAGNFSWDRRPIWVIVNGRRLAASMNCMPHGYDSLPNNDFKGQFCIHFVGSKTHGSQKVDPDHQKAIEEAYQAGLKTTATPTPSPKPTATPSAKASGK